MTFKDDDEISHGWQPREQTCETLKTMLAAYGPAEAAPSVVSLRALLRVIGAREWRIRGRLLRTNIRAAAFLTIKVLWVWCRTDRTARLCEFCAARDSSGR
jgi:hypothetical protein